MGFYETLAALVLLFLKLLKFKQVKGRVSLLLHRARDGAPRAAVSQDRLKDRTNTRAA